jgi:hypothetical protein
VVVLNAAIKQGAKAKQKIRNNSEVDGGLSLKSLSRVKKYRMGQSFLMRFYLFFFKNQRIL